MWTTILKIAVALGLDKWARKKALAIATKVLNKAKAKAGAVANAVLTPEEKARLAAAAEEQTLSDKALGRLFEEDAQ